MRSFNIYSTILFVITVSIITLFATSVSAAGTRLGGMNLGGYCASIGAGGVMVNNTTWTCTNGTAVDMNAACQWQYPNQNAVASQDTPGNPYSWTCYAGSAPQTPTPTPTPTNGAKLGGMNIDGYCNSINKPGVTLSNNTWYCGNGTSAINLTAVCQWQYAISNAVASQDLSGNPYSWSCYVSTGESTPTPTATKTPTPTLTSTPTPTPSQSTKYYLTLGDSFAFGFHQALFNQEEANGTYNPATFNDGYDADFYKDLQGKSIANQEINYSCPGETSTSFINGGCVGHSSTLPLHNNYPVSQSQLQAAVSFLQAHPNQVATITIDIGVNDAINFANTCQAQSSPVTCYTNGTQTVLNKVKQNYDTIFNALQQAAPKSEIIIVMFPNPVYYDGTDNLVNGLNTIQQQEATSRALKLADTFSIFTADNICSYTNFCASPSDFHPTALGYNTMAQVIWNTSGY